MAKSTTEINPCACGGKAVPCVKDSDLAMKYYVQCVKCGRKTETHLTVPQAVFDWNSTGGT